MAPGKLAPGMHKSGPAALDSRPDHRSSPPCLHWHLPLLCPYPCCSMHSRRVSSIYSIIKELSKGPFQRRDGRGGYVDWSSSQMGDRDSPCQTFLAGHARPWQQKGARTWSAFPRAIAHEAICGVCHGCSHLFLPFRLRLDERIAHVPCWLCLTESQKWRPQLATAQPRPIATAGRVLR
jgi:hypothetical protein